jgi:hypothetical protein
MPIWKLAPILSSVSDAAWAYSRWFGSAVVRAANPKQARQIAAEAFRKAEEYENDPAALDSPWLSDELVACQRVPVSTFPPQGPELLLQPHVNEYRRASAP